MKTPRELLLARHQTAIPQLDALRRRIVAEHVGGPAFAPGDSTSGLLTRLWTELFWSCRRAWVGLAAVWIVLLALHLAVRDTPPRTVAQSIPPPSANLRVVLAEQQRLRAELLGVNLPLTREPRSSAVPGPRSEQCGSVIAV